MVTPGDSSNSRSEPSTLMPQGSRYAGQPVDSSSRRSVRIASGGGGQELIGSTDTRVVVDYFYHAEVFWTAVVPLEGVDQVFGQAFNFSKPRTKPGANGPEFVLGKHGLPKRKNPILNHVQSRFRLKPGSFVELYPLGADPTGAPAHRIDDFVYSLEAVGPVGTSFNLRDALAGNSISAHRFFSTEEMVFERIVVENQYVTESSALLLDDAEKRAVLAGSLLRSHHAGMTERYYLYRVCGTNNCTSSPLQIVDTVKNYSLPQRIGSTLYRLPLSPRFYLWIRGLDSDPSVRKLVRDEFEAFVQAPETRKRKRDYVRRMTRARRAAREAGIRERCRPA